VAVLGRLYRGLLPEVAGGMPRSSAMYAGFAAAQRHLIQLNGGVSSAPVAFAAGAASGIPEAMVATPFQVSNPFKTLAGAVFLVALLIARSRPTS